MEIGVLAVKVTIIRYADHSQPGWVECKLTDAQGTEWSFIEKVPVVTRAELDMHSIYPQPGVIACRIIDRSLDIEGREIVTIDTSTPWTVESTSGTTRFDVFLNQLLDVA